MQIHQTNISFNHISPRPGGSYCASSVNSGTLKPYGCGSLVGLLPAPSGSTCSLHWPCCTRTLLPTLLLLMMLPVHHLLLKQGLLLLLFLIPPVIQQPGPRRRPCLINRALMTCCFTLPVCACTWTSNLFWARLVCDFVALN